MQHPTRKSSKSLASKQRLPGIQRSRNTIQNKNNKSDRLIEIDPEFTDIRISKIQSLVVIFSFPDKSFGELKYHKKFLITGNRKF